jgi:hypothetical protein
MLSGARVHRVEQGYPQVFRHRHRDERPRQLEAARHAAMRAHVGGEPVHGVAVEMHGAGFVLQRAAHAVDQR